MFLITVNIDFWWFTKTKKNQIEPSLLYFSLHPQGTCQQLLSRRWCRDVQWWPPSRRLGGSQEAGVGTHGEDYRATNRQSNNGTDVDIEKFGMPISHWRIYFLDCLSALLASYRDLCYKDWWLLFVIGHFTLYSCSCSLLKFLHHH